MRSRNLLICMVAGFALLAAAELALTRVLTASTEQATLSVGTPAIGGPFQLTDDKGVPVTQAALAGKPTAIYFGYTYCPEVCPTTLADLSRWIGQLGADADKMNYVFVTVDPERDTPKVLREYLGSFDKHIRGFTGTPEQIAKLAKEYKVYYKKVPTKDGYLIDHAAMIYLMNSNGAFAGIIPYQAEDAAADAKLRKLIANPRSS